MIRTFERRRQKKQEVGCQIRRLGRVLGKLSDRGSTRIFHCATKPMGADFLFSKRPRAPAGRASPGFCDVHAIRISPDATTIFGCWECDWNAATRQEETKIQHTKVPPGPVLAGDVPGGHIAGAMLTGLESGISK